MFGPCATTYITSNTVPVNSGLVPQVVKHPTPVGPGPSQGRFSLRGFGEEVLTYANEPFADEPTTSILQCHIVSVVITARYRGGR